MTFALCLLIAAAAVALICVLAAASSNGEMRSLDQYIDCSGCDSSFVRAAELVGLKHLERSANGTQYSRAPRNPIIR